MTTSRGVRIGIGGCCISHQARESKSLIIHYSLFHHVVLTVSRRTTGKDHPTAGALIIIVQNLYFMYTSVRHVGQKMGKCRKCTTHAQYK